MRILIVNWSPASAGAAVGGGVGGYSWSLAQEMRRRGASVAMISSGAQFAPTVSPGADACTLRNLPPVDGIQILDILNAPGLAPAHDHLGDPWGELSNPPLEREFARACARIRPDIVHIQNIEGFTPRCVDLARDAGARVLWSLHNYHAFCPQVYLLQQGRRPCHSFDSGRNCPACIESLGGMGRWRRVRLERTLHATNTHLANLLSARAWPAPTDPNPHPSTPITPTTGPWRTIEPSPDIAPDRPPYQAPDAGPDPTPGRRLQLPTLDNTPSPDPMPEGPASIWGVRRQHMIAALNRCDRVLAVSRFVLEKHAALGVDRRRLTLLPIGTAMSDLARDVRAARAASAPTVGPIRLAFLGYNNPFKGLAVLLTALEQLPPEAAARFSLDVAGKDLDRDVPRLRALARRLARVRTLEPYAWRDVPAVTREVDLGIVPSVWWDNGPQTVLEFQACGIPVIGSALGGIPDAIRDGVDGRLFPGGDAAALATILATLTHDHITIWRRALRVPTTMREHADILASVYAGMLATPEAHHAGAPA